MTTEMLMQFLKGTKMLLEERMNEPAKDMIQVIKTRVEVAGIDESTVAGRQGITKDKIFDSLDEAMSEISRQSFVDAHMVIDGLKNQIVYYGVQGYEPMEGRRSE